MVISWEKRKYLGQRRIGLLSKEEILSKYGSKTNQITFLINEQLGNPNILFAITDSKLLEKQRVKNNKSTLNESYKQRDLVG